MLGNYLTNICLVNHMANLKCDQCGYEAKDENDLKQHKTKSHKAGGGGGQTMTE